jgi:multidrug efflux pump subunit AcrA (membrane-fusion protein)
MGKTMRNPESIWLVGALLIFGLGSGCGQEQTPQSDNGHGHGQVAAEPAQAAAHGPAPVSLTLFTPKVELFMEYPQLVRGTKARALAHVTVLSTGQPVRKGTLAFEATAPDGKLLTLKMEAPARDGIFIPEPTFEVAGRYKARLILQSPQVEDTIDIGELVVHADQQAALQAAEASSEPDPPGAVPFLAEQQWKIGVILEQVDERTLIHRLALPGQVVAPQGASAIVVPPVAGRLLPPPGGKLPRIGETVQAGQVLAMIEPPMPLTEALQLSANRAQVQSLETELSLRELDLDTRALEVERSIIQSKARLDFAERVMDRASQLKQKGVGTEQQYEEAEQNLRLAKAEHEASNAMKTSYQAAKERLAALRTKTLPPDSQPAATTSLQLPLRSPITGQILEAQHIEGEHLDGQAEVFHILNRDRVWIEAKVSEFDLTKLSDQPGATMTLPAYPGKRFDILGSDGGRLVNIGCAVHAETRTVSVVYEMSNPDGLLRPGMVAEVYLETRTANEAVAIPESAIVMDNGKPITFALLSGEKFQRRELELGVRDNGYVEVKSGVQAGDRVAAKGGYAIKLSSLSSASFGAGHGH